MLADMGFVGVVARQLDMIEAVEWSVEVRPEIEVLQRRIGFQRWIFRRGVQGLEVGFADQRRSVTSRCKYSPTVGSVSGSLVPSE